MRIEQLIFSLILYIAFCIYIFFSIYIIELDSNSRLNRIFFIICLALGLWSFSFSVSNYSSLYMDALFWRRTSALGWGTIYSFFLHFILILTGYRKLLSRKYTYLFLYTPALINVLVFSLLGDVAFQQHNLIHTEFGWNNISLHKFWDWYFNIYYASFTLSGIYFLWRWGRSSNDKSIKFQSNLLVASFCLALILGSFTDIFGNIVFSYKFPQMAPIIILIPIASILICIKHFRLFSPKTPNKPAEEGKILNEAVRNRVFNSIFVIYILGSFLTFAIRYFIYYDDLNFELIFSSVGIFIGLLILSISKIKIKESYKDFILAILLGITVPFLTFRFKEFAFVAIWAIPFIFIILSAVFNRRIVLVLISLFTLFTQVWLLTKFPTATVTMNITDHIIRIVILLFAILSAFYINNIYIRRLKENEEQFKVHKLISKVSAEFVKINNLNYSDKIYDILEVCGKHFYVDRAFILLYTKADGKVVFSSEWCKDNITPLSTYIDSINLNMFTWLKDQHSKFGMCHIPDIELLPDEASYEKGILKNFKIKSMITSSISNQEEMLGVWGFQNHAIPMQWNENHKELVTIIANILKESIKRSRAENKISQMAYYDELTALPNRYLFKNKLEENISLLKNDESFIGIILLDLDSFKDINDTMGHDAGDLLLVQVADRLSHSVRKHDIVSRFGEDEFLIMMTNISSYEVIKRIAGNINKKINKPFIIKGQELYISASIGVSVCPYDGDNSESLIKNADMAMYFSKENGKNQFTVCCDKMKESLHNKMKLTTGLYNAIEKNEFVLHYQPQVCTVSNRIIGLEALVRWNHPELGLLMPGSFISIAEQTGLINSIGEWVLETACKQNMEFQAKGLEPVCMAVNISVEQLRNPNLVATVERVLKENGMNAKLLELEVTESIAVRESIKIVKKLEELKNIGIQISIDDFGTEYSSLSRLKILPVDKIKIDMQFIRGVLSNQKDEAITRTIIMLGKNLGLGVIAEGVETKEQVDFLSSLSCDEIQGYYYYKPAPYNEIEQILFRDNNK